MSKGLWAPHPPRYSKSAGQDPAAGGPEQLWGRQAAAALSTLTISTARECITSPSQELSWQGQRLLAKASFCYCREMLCREPGARAIRQPDLSLISQLCSANLNQPVLPAGRQAVLSLQACWGWGTYLHRASLAWSQPRLAPRSPAPGWQGRGHRCVPSHHCLLLSGISIHRSCPWSNIQVLIADFISSVP